MDFQKDFPILKSNVNGKPLIYFDNAATSQKPKYVINSINNYYQNYNSNVHRGVHELSQKATKVYEGSRVKIQNFIGAKSSKEIIFTKGTTDGINIIASSWAETQLTQGDEIIITTMEHHSNIVPWQILCEKIGAKLIISPINKKGEMIMSEFKSLISNKTKLISVSHVSNTLGTINPVKDIVEIAKENNCKVLIDAAQSIPHFKVDVSKIDCDFLVFSGHKIFAPTGIGVLYVKNDRYQEMKPYQGGGDMIEYVSFEKTTFAKPPERFEAGTPHISGAIGLGAAIDYVNWLGRDAVATHEDDLLHYATARISELPGIRLFGTEGEKASIVSFLHDDVHPHDVGTILDQAGIAVRVGHHCAQPLMDRFGITGTVRASIGLYNTRDDIDRLVESLDRVEEIFG